MMKYDIGPEGNYLLAFEGKPLPMPNYIEIHSVSEMKNADR